MIMKTKYIDIRRQFLAMAMMICTMFGIMAENVVKIESVNVIAGQTVSIPILLENSDNISSLQMDITLPKGIVYVDGSIALNSSRANAAKFDVMLTDVTSKYTDELKTQFSAESVYRLLVLTKDDSAISGNSGKIATVSVDVAADFLQHSELNIVKIIGSHQAQKVDIAECLDVAVISLNLVNDEAFTRLSAEIATVQTALDAAKAEVEADCKDVAANFATTIAEIQQSIDNLKADIEAKYNNIELRAESTIDTASINAAIEKLKTDAAAAQRDYVVAQNEAAYTRLTKQIADTQAKLDAVKNSINTDCKDVAGQFVNQFASIQSSIDVLSADVKSKYDKVELTAQSAVDTDTIIATIDKLFADAKAAQQAYDDKKKANENAYTSLSAVLANVQTTLDEAKTHIQTNCADVATYYTVRLDAVQAKINEEKATLDAKYQKMELTAESAIDTTALYADIAQIKADADKAQAAHDAEVAKKAANEAAYAKLNQQIADVQAKFDEAKNKIDTECKDVAGQFAGQYTSIQSSIDALAADVKTKYENVELTAESAIDTTSIVAAIEQLIADAIAAQAEFERQQAEDAKKAANEAAYTRLNTLIAEVQKSLDAAKITIEVDCDDVAANYTATIAEIQKSIDALTADVKAKYDNIELTAESTIDTVTIATAIEKLLADAKAAQAAHDAKIAANEDAYARLTVELANIQSSLEQAKAKIQVECADVATNYEAAISEIQKSIDTLKADVEAKYKNIELTADSSIDTASISALIEKLISEATEAQAAFEAEEARKAANEEAYTRLTTQLAEVQKSLDEAKVKIETECKDVAANYVATIDEIQKTIDTLKADVEVRYKNIELTADSTIDTAPISASIDKLIAEATAAQAEFEAEEARKAANEEAYLRLKENIASVQARLDEAINKINSECKDVAELYTESCDSIQDIIDVLSAELDAMYERVELTSESTIDTAAILTAIEQLLADAIEAQKKFEESGVNSIVRGEANVKAIYTLNGKLVLETKPNVLYIFVYEDGRVEKVIAK